MRGRIKLGLTSGALLVASSVAYHFCSPVSWHGAATPVASVTSSSAKVSAPAVTASAIAPASGAISKTPETKPVARSLRSAISSAEMGMASWYGGLFNGKRTANGEVFDTETMTACHRTLPFGTLVRVINLATGRSVVVRINDRGSMTPSRIIDLSHAAAAEIGMLGAGVARVRLEVLSKVKGKDSRGLGTLAR